VNEHDIAARVLGAQKLARQEQAELGKAEPCDPPMGIETPAQINRIRDAIAADRCDGESEYARGINAACENHLKLIDTMLDYKFSEPEVPAADQTPPADADGTEPEQETAGALIEDAGDFMRTITNEGRGT
jgi:hypothetical protein